MAASPTSAKYVKPTGKAIVVGPVVGLVTASSARILVEVAEDCTLTATLVEPRNHNAAGPSTTLELMGGRPTVFEVTGLKSNTVYHLSLEGATNTEDRKGSFKTWTENGANYPTSILCVSCNKPSELEAGHPSPWTFLYANHHSQPTGRPQLILHMGDQVYADEVFERMRAAHPKLPYNDNDRAEIFDAFRDLYRQVWNTADIRHVLANGSNLMIWDDHEVRDDWGSRASDRDVRTVDYALGEIARAVYREYQRSLWNPSNDDNTEWVIQSYGKVGVLMVDQRGGRSFAAALKAQRSPYLGDDQWAAIRGALAPGGEFDDATALVVSTTVPLVFATKTMTEALINLGLNDLRDHWVHGEINEAVELLDALSAWKKAGNGRQVIVTGGDVHMGMTTQITHTDGTTFQQVIASPITNHPPTAVPYNAVKSILEVGERLNKDWSFEHSKYTNKRNYGSITIRAGAVEGEVVVCPDGSGSGCCSLL